MEQKWPEGHALLVDIRRYIGLYIHHIKNV